MRPSEKSKAIAIEDKFHFVLNCLLMPSHSETDYSDSIQVPRMTSIHIEISRRFPREVRDIHVKMTEGMLVL